VIAVRLEGRLGNQLFQYAFIYAASRKLDTTFYLDKSIDGFMLPRYFNVKNDTWRIIDNSIFSVKGYKNIFNIHSKKAFYGFISKLAFRGKHIKVDDRIPPEKALLALKDGCLYEGFFQSEIYFEGFQDDIRALFQVKREHLAAFGSVAGQLDSSKKKIVVHVRRGDYVNLDLTLPVSYYKKAIEMIDSTDAEYIFISDDPLFVEAEFGYIQNKYVSTQSEIIDLQFLMNADVCVLSNSSFSWWGAWLNANKSKKIIAPAMWLGKDIVYPAGVLQRDWDLVYAD
jgi:hypothetical protein